VSEVGPVQPTPQVPQYFNKIEWDTDVVKKKVTVNGAESTQTETIYTYDKHGKIVSTVIYEKSINLLL